MPTLKSFFAFSRDLEGGAACYNLAMLYLHGDGVSQDFSKAIEYMTISAEKGCIEAQLYMGMAYTLGCAFEPDVIVLLIGINDIGRRYKTGEKHIETSDEQLELNYRSILIQLRKHTKAKILMLSPFILDADIKKLFVLTDESGEPMRSDVEKIIPTIKALADEYADGFIPLKALFDEAMKTQPEPLYYSADGIHPNENGAQFIARLCADKLKTII